jgi:hypothetical protein
LVLVRRLGADKRIGPLASWVLICLYQNFQCFSSVLTMWCGQLPCYFWQSHHHLCSTSKFLTTLLRLIPFYWSLL